MIAEQAAGVRMGIAENPLFGDVEGAELGGGEFEAILEFRMIEDGVDEKSQVVKQAGQIGFFKVGVADFAGQGLGDKSAAEGVAPERVGVEHPLVFGDGLVHAQAEKEGTYPLDAEDHDGSAGGFDRAASEEGRICHAKTMRGNGSVTGNEFHDLFDLDVVHGQTHHPEQRLKDGGSGGDRMELGDSGFELNARSVVHGLPPATAPAVGFQ